MIPVYPLKCQDNSWKNELKEAISDPFLLLKMLNLSPNQLDFAIDPNSRFMMRVPRPFIKKMQLGDPEDPLLRQVLSQATENQQVEGFTHDPLAETGNTLPGMLHKYHGRVLLILASACAVNCRYCFRRHFPYPDQLANGKNLEQSIDYIARTESISEVILSGGDPLIVSDGLINELFNRLAKIQHLRRIRFHTRLPVVIPQRVTPQLVDILRNSSLKTSMVLHINHPNEIDQPFTESIAQLVDAGIPLLNQSVLLKGINDQTETLVELSEKLFDAGILPYYIHQLDRVQGAAHFLIDEANAIELINSIRDKLPGYLVPRLAREDAGAKSKTLLC